MSDTCGKIIKYSVIGTSRSEKLEARIENFPAGVFYDEAFIENFMRLRAPGNNAFSSSRKEPDIPVVLSGIKNGYTDGNDIVFYIANQDAKNTSEDRNNVPRPMHADYPASVRYKDIDLRGGGKFSGRLTAPFCFFGALCELLLKKYSITVGAHALSIHGETDAPFDSVNLSPETLESLKTKPFPILSSPDKMLDIIASAKQKGDSVGGMIECAAVNLPVGVGEPLFDSLESKIASLVFSIPAVKGIEFGSGFSASKLFGSEHNDAYIVENGKIKTKTNNHGGILGGLSTGMPLIFKAAVKPTPSISLPQTTVNKKEMRETELKIDGRNDPCIVFRAVPCVESACAIAITDLMLEGGFIK